MSSPLSLLLTPCMAARTMVGTKGIRRRYGLNSLSTPLPIWSINIYGKSPPFRHTFRERAGQTFA